MASKSFSMRYWMENTRFKWNWYVHKFGKSRTFTTSAFATAVPIWTRPFYKSLFACLAVEMGMTVRLVEEPGLNTIRAIFVSNRAYTSSKDRPFKLKDTL